MSSQTSFHLPSGRQFNTLAQRRTKNITKDATLLTGTGTDLNLKEAAKGRAKRKTITNTLVLNLIDIAKESGNNTLITSLWNTYHCQQRVFVHNGLSFGKYCKNRVCTLCNSIRKAKTINEYLPIIQTWEDPQFLTLTIRAVKKHQLKKFVRGMFRAFSLIKEAERKRYSRGNGLKLMGIKSLECNFNPKSKTYNPHFHLIVPNKEIAELLINEWLKKWTSKHALRSGQFYRPIKKDCTEDLVEVVKYGSKVFTECDKNEYKELKIPPKIYLQALYNILDAFQGERLFDRFGFNKPTTAAYKPVKTVKIEDCEEYIFEPLFGDWISTETGSLLTNFRLTFELDNLLTNNMDRTTQ